MAIAGMTAYLLNGVLCGLKIWCQCPLRDEGPPELANRQLDQLSLQELADWVRWARGFCAKLTVKVISDVSELPVDAEGRPIDAPTAEDYADARAWALYVQQLFAKGTCASVW